VSIGTLERHQNQMLSEELEAEPLTDHFRMDELKELLAEHVVHLVRADTDVSGSFKWRGAANAVAHLPADTTEVVTGSAGNHAGGIVVAAARNGLRATVVVPVGTADMKFNKLDRLWLENNGIEGGLTLVKHGENVDESLDYVISEFPDAAFIHPFDNRDVIRGQGSLMPDVRRAIPGITHAFVPAGGGALMAGMHEAANGEVLVYGVEAPGSDSLSRSAATGLWLPRNASSPNPRYPGSYVLKPSPRVLEVLHKTGFEPSQLVTAEERDTLELAMYYRREGEKASGVRLEPTSLLAVAGLVKLVRMGALPKNSTIGVIATGHNQSPLDLLRPLGSGGVTAGGFVGSRVV
jgi:threonine dehydratase